MTKFVVVVGGVISGVGKGVTTASVGKIFKEHGFSTTLIKIDPYINFDAGTLRPTEHGEVWVTDDGGEIDQDLGTYERFMDQDIPKQNNITTGQIYKTVIDKERRGEYLGETVQFIPHIPDEIIRRIKEASEGFDIAIIEIGGTVGDYENVPFLFALKALERDLGADSFVYMLVTYLPIPSHISEMKTKPTQQAIKLLRQEGVTPDFIICRGKQALDDIRKKKIETYLHIDSEYVISAPDVDTIYQVPLDLEQEQMGKKILGKLKLTSKKQPDWHSWQSLVHALKYPANRVRVAIVGKYLDTGDFSLTDSYVSIYQALIHAGASLNTGIDIVWIDAKRYEKDDTLLSDLLQFNGIVIPGGFGNAGTEGKIKVLHYARVNNIPCIGLCYGLQLSIIEFARNVCNLPHAHSTEVNPQAIDPVIDILPLQKQILAESEYGGSMRLGSYTAQIRDDSKVYDLYAQHNRLHNNTIQERHRHRYEVNPAYIERLEAQGIMFSGFHTRKDGTKLVEFAEFPNHPFFVTTQAHPEFKSRLGNPSPLFYGFVQACVHHQ